MMERGPESQRVYSMDPEAFVQSTGPEVSFAQVQTCNLSLGRGLMFATFATSQCIGESQRFMQFPNHW